MAYLDFITEVTNDVLTRGIFTNRVLCKVFEEHVQKNKKKLDEVTHVRSGWSCLLFWVAKGRQILTLAIFVFRIECGVCWIISEMTLALIAMTLTEKARKMWAWAVPDQQ